MKEKRVMGMTNAGDLANAIEAYMKRTGKTILDSDDWNSIMASLVKDNKATIIGETDKTGKEIADEFREGGANVGEI